MKSNQINIVNELKKNISLNPTHPISNHVCLYNYEQRQISGVFSTNKSYKIQTHLSAPLVLEETWRVALVEADIVCTTSKTDAIYLYSDIYGEYIVECERRPLLRRLTCTSVGNWMTVAETTFYVPMKSNNIVEIDVYITTDQDDLASFLDQHSPITLHLKSFLFF